MFNPFPELLIYSLLAPFVIRTALGFIFVRLGANVFTVERHAFQNIFKEMKLGSGLEVLYILGAIEVIGGALLILGFYTQLAAVALAVLSFIFVITSHFGRHFGKETMLFNFLMFAGCVSLLFSGAGFFALDLPL